MFDRGLVPRVDWAMVVVPSLVVQLEQLVQLVQQVEEGMVQVVARGLVLGSVLEALVLLLILQVARRTFVGLVLVKRLLWRTGW